MESFELTFETSVHYLYMVKNRSRLMLNLTQTQACTNLFGEVYMFIILSFNISGIIN